MTTVLMSTFGSYGNTAPFLRLGQELSMRGHEVHIWTNYQLNGALLPHDMHFHPVGGPRDYRKFTDDAHLLNRFQTLPIAFRRYYLPVVERELGEMEQQYRPGRTLVLASDAPGVSARLFAEKYRTPLISVFTYPNQFQSASMIGTLLCGPLRSDMENIRAAVGLAPLFDAHGWWGQPHHYFALWPDWFGRGGTTGVAKVSFAGFIYHDPEPVLSEDCELFLNHPGPFVLVSGGSAGFAGETFHKVAVDAIRSAGLRAIVVSPSFIDEVPQILRADSVPSLPALLRRAAAVIHHGGMGTIGQSVHAGTPQLVLADGGDRPENGEIVQHLGLGRFFRRSDWRVEKLHAALLDVVHLPAIRQATALAARRIQDSGGLSTAISTIERMADRAQLVESCVYAASCSMPMRPAERGGGKIAEALDGMSPERRYLLARTLRSRRS